MVVPDAYLMIQTRRGSVRVAGLEPQRPGPTNEKRPPSVGWPASSRDGQTPKRKKAAQRWLGGLEKSSGGVLLSHRENPAVPSAQRGLTTEFGMGSGVTLSLWPPEKLFTTGECASCDLGGVNRRLRVRVGQASRAISTG